MDLCLQRPDIPNAPTFTFTGQIMELHHKKHHQAYITNYNAALEQLKEVRATLRLQLSFTHVPELWELLATAHSPE